MKEFKNQGMNSASEQSKLDKEAVNGNTPTKPLQKQKRKFKTSLLKPCVCGPHNPNFNNPRKSISIY